MSNQTLSLQSQIITSIINVVIFMPRCTVHRRHTVVRSCVGLSVPRFLGLSDFAYLCER